VQRIPKDAVGKHVRILWDDVGAQDGIIVSVDDDLRAGTFLPLTERSTQSIQAEQVLKIGSHVTATNSGLN
jgi:hypothetical protein